MDTRLSLSCIYTERCCRVNEFAEECGNCIRQRFEYCTHPSILTSPSTSFEAASFPSFTATSCTPTPGLPSGNGLAPCSCVAAFSRASRSRSISAASATMSPTPIFANCARCWSRAVRRASHAQRCLFCKRQKEKENFRSHARVFSNRMKRYLFQFQNLLIWRRSDGWRGGCRCGCGRRCWCRYTLCLGRHRCWRSRCWRRLRL